MTRVPTTRSAAPTAAKRTMLQPQGAFAREQTGTRAGNQTQETARAATAQARANPFASGNLITNVYLSSSTTVIPHGLGRKFAGFFVVNQRRDPVHGASSPVDVIRIENSNSQLDAVQIQLASDGSYLCDVWVY